MKTTSSIDQDNLIAEYTLGLSSPEQARQIQARLSRDDAAAACALKWETYLLGISDSLEPVEPPPELFAQVQKALGHETITPAPDPIPTPAASAAESRATEAPPAAIEPRPAPAREPRHKEPPPSPDKLRSWRITAVLLGITAVVLAIFLARAWSRPEVPPVQIVRVAPTQAAILQAPGDTSTPGWLMTVDTLGNVRLDPKVRTDIQPDESVQLWTRGSDDRKSRSLGLIDPNRAITIPVDIMGALQPDQVFEMTLEQKGGSASGRPQGPVLFIGRMVTFGAQSSSKPLA